METKASGKTFSWFYEDGPENDVIISTRARIVRNLADFKFPSKMSEDDVRRVVSLAEDAFNYDENFQFVRASELSKTGLQVLRDNTMIGNNNFQAFAMNNKEAVICLVNELNHLKIINFDCGFDPEKVMKNVYKVDENLQKKLQFAASYEFGYLTSQIKDCGTGLRISIRIFIPSIVLSGRFPEFSKKLASGDNFYIDLAGSNLNYTCPMPMDDIKAAYNAGYNLVCRCTVDAYTATLPLFFPMPNANIWLFSGSGALKLSDIEFPPQSFTVAIIDGSVVAQLTQFATKDDMLPNPNALTFTGAVTGSYDGSAPLSVNIPSAVTDAHINELINTALNAIGVAEEGAY